MTLQRAKDGAAASTAMVRGGAEHWRAWDAADAAQREAAAREAEAAGLRQRLDAAEARSARLAARNASDEALVLPGADALAHTSARAPFGHSASKGRKGKDGHSACAVTVGTIAMSPSFPCCPLMLSAPSGPCYPSHPAHICPLYLCLPALFSVSTAVIPCSIVGECSRNRLLYFR